MIKTIRIDGNSARCVEHDITARGIDVPDALRDLARILELVGPRRLEEIPPAPGEWDVSFVNRIIAVGKRILCRTGPVTVGEALDAIEAPTWRPFATAPTDGRRVLLRWRPAGVGDRVAVIAYFGGEKWKLSWNGEVLKNVDFTEWAEIPLW